MIFYKLLKRSSCMLGLCLAALMSMLTVSGAMAQGRTVSGTVTDASSGSPLVGVSVVVRGTSAGTITDGQGNYTLSIPASAEEDPVLQFSYVGYNTLSEIVGVRTTVNAAIGEDVSGIDQVVVIGYGKTTKKEITGSVANLQSDDFAQGTFTNAAGLLQGKVAGLQIVNPNGGDPSAKFEMLLRGTGTLMGNQSPLVIIDGVAGADLLNINFNEVESIDILKDGSAAAIYGPRGSNGVVIVTTKRARAGSTNIEYNGQVSTEVVARRAVPLTAGEFRHVIETYAPQQSQYLYDSDTDWFKEITRDMPISHKHNLSISGGSDRFAHHTSLSMERNQGLQRRNNVNKTIGRTNIHQKAFEGWLDIDYNLFASLREYKPSNTDAFAQAFTYNPTQPVYDDVNPDAGGYSWREGLEYRNPVALVNERDRKSQTDDYGGNVRFTLNILPVQGLRFDNFISFERSRWEEHEYRTRYYPSNLGLDGRANIENGKQSTLLYESTLNYSQYFGKHSVQALLGYSYEDKEFNNSWMQNTGYDFDFYKTDNIGAGTGLLNGNAEMGSYRSMQRSISFFGRVMYNFDEKYLLSVSVRRDGNSAYGADNKWGWFPAVSAGWRLSEENFLRDVEWLNELKVRGGYGVTGNQGIDPYKSLMLIGQSGKFYYNGQWINTYKPTTNANGQLRWEKKHEYNIGFDMSMLANRFNVTFDYYKRTSKDLLYEYEVPVPPYVEKTFFTNVGQISNRGVELTLSGVPVQTRDFSWNTTFIVSHNKNKLDRLTNEEFNQAPNRTGFLTDPITQYSQRLIEGESLGTFYAPIWLGIDENGNDVLKGQDLNGNVAEENWEKVGNAFPKATLSWSNTFRYRNFDLNFSLRASLGGKALNQYGLIYENLTRAGLRNIMGSWLDNPQYTGNIKYSSKYIEDASFLKLDNITLGYNLDFDSKYFRGMRVYFSAQNVFCWTKYSGLDPEVAMSGLAPGIESLTYYPRTAVLTLGLNLKF